MRSLLNHAVQLDRRYAQHLHGGDASARSMEAALQKFGAPETCYVISADEGLDGQEMPLLDALDTVAASYFGAFISCIPGKLGYFQYEDMKSAYVLKK